MTQKEINTSPRPPRQRASRTQGALCAALLQLLEEQSFDQITVKEITARANVGYATFFRRYTDKDELLHDLAAEEIRRLLSMTLPILYSVDSQASTEALCAYVWKHQKLWSALLNGGAAATLKQEYLRQALELAESTPSKHEWLPDDLAVTFAVTSSIELLTWWLKSDKAPSVKKMAQFVNHLAIAPIYPGEEPVAKRPRPTKTTGRNTA